MPIWARLRKKRNTVSRHLHFKFIFNVLENRNIHRLCRKKRLQEIWSKRILLSRSTLEPLISLDLVGTKFYCFIGLGSIVTITAITCILFSQPILWDVPKRRSVTMIIALHASRCFKVTNKTCFIDNLIPICAFRSLTPYQINLLFAPLLLSKTLIINSIVDFASVHGHLRQRVRYDFQNAIIWIFSSTVSLHWDY